MITIDLLDVESEEHHMTTIKGPIFPPRVKSTTVPHQSWGNDKRDKSEYATGVANQQQYGLLWFHR